MARYIGVISRKILLHNVRFGYSINTVLQRILYIDIGYVVVLDRE